jgi:hypothetical protein
MKMPDNECRWFNENEIHSNEEFKEENNYFPDEKIVSCQLTKLFYFSEKRNSYGNEYEADNGIHINLELAKKSVESLRKPGSYFLIKEVAALAFSGEKTSIVLVPFDADCKEPFVYMNEISPIEEELNTIRETAKYINKLCHGSLSCYFTDNQNLNTFTTPQLENNSMAYQGSYYYLAYYKPTKKNNQDISNLLNIFNLINNYFTKLFEKRQQEEWQELVKKHTN